MKLAVMDIPKEKYFELSKSGDADKYQLIQEYKWFPQATESLPDTFMSMRDELNNVKSLLNCMPLAKWHAHTRHQNPAGFVISEVRKKADPELLTQAWCKFMEIIWKFPNLVPLSNSSSNIEVIHVKFDQIY